MKILHISDHTKRFNGMAHAAVDLACTQARLGHTVAICCGVSGFEELFAEAGVERLPLIAPGAAAPALASVAGVWRAVRRFRPDVIHTHMVRSTLLTWPIAKLAGTPLVTCVQNSFSRASVWMGVGDRVVTGCEAVARDMARRGVPARKLRPVLNGTIGSPRYSAEPPPPVELQRPAVITMCGLHPRKGVADLIEGFEAARARRPELHLYILGEGPYEQAYRDQVQPEHRAYVHFLGAARDPRAYLRGADLFVLASHADPAPLAICEAREAQLPILATAVDGIPELVESGKAGMLIPPRDAKAICEALCEIFSSAERLAQLRQDSQINVEKLSVERVASATVDVYAEAMSAGNRRETGKNTEWGAVKAEVGGV
jgi:glycosyltransferase involved in cell wall biosynthesis